MKIGINAILLHARDIGNRYLLGIPAAADVAATINRRPEGVDYLGRRVYLDTIITAASY